ncbi:MAG: GNAT family N-acetyltransferase [Bacteroidaceae bacterium]|nr:GNAT family N-acetyltransferase [Bacteroidaceae bacterium]
MILLYSLSRSAEWDATVRSFKEYDVYYLSGYVKAFHIHGDGGPYLFYYESPSLKAIYVYMRRPTALEGVYDSVTPYGYGGVLFEGDTSEENKAAFLKEYLQFMEQEHIVDNFVRYHPVLRNAEPMKSISNVIDLGKTIAFDLSSPEVIWDNIISKNRNMIRKAEKNGIEIRHGKDMALFEDFRRIYNATMDKDHAEEYYYFGDAFYASIHNDLHDNYEMFYAVLDGQIIAMSIILFANKQMHYHLSGSMIEFRNLAPSNLLLYKVALWGCEQGYKTFHLGGGVGSGEDNLYKFKAAFNKKSDYQFSIGKQIFDQAKYDELVAMRASQDAEFNRESKFFPLYRA